MDGVGWKRFILKDKKIEMEGVKSFLLESAESPMYFVPGQHIIMRFSDLENDQRGRMRHFSMCTSPLEGKFIGITTTIDEVDSPFKNRLDSIGVGEEIDVFGAMGKFIFEPKLWKESIIVLIAGGIGITPFRSMIKYALSMDGNFRIRLFYSGKSATGFVFKNELEKMAAEDGRLGIFYTMTGESEMAEGMHRGRINSEFIGANVENIDNSSFYICGPPRMVEEITGSIISDLNVTRDRINVEQFIGY